MNTTQGITDIRRERSLHVISTVTVAIPAAGTRTRARVSGFEIGDPNRPEDFERNSNTEC